MRRMCAVLVALAVLLAVAAPVLRPSLATAQDGPDIDRLLEFSLEDAELPPERVIVRLLYVNLEPDSSNPRHTHPGPEFWRIDSGTVTVELQGPAVIQRAGESEVEGAPVDQEFQLTRGDKLLILPSTPMFFRNDTEEAARILAAVILPFGHQAPEPIDYLGEEVSADAYEGVTFPILGDGMLEAIPSGTKTLTIDRVRLRPGDPLPSSDQPTLMTVARGSIDLTVEGGLVNGPTRTDSPGATDAMVAPGTELTLERYDALFFPAGVAEATRAENFADVTLLRVILSGDETGATPVVAEDVATLTVRGPVAEATPTPEATEEPTGAATTEPTQEATEEPTPAPTGRFAEGQTVYVNETAVRLRDAPTTQSNIITGLTLGQALTIGGASVDADGFTWWPVVFTDGSGTTGWVADQFLSPDPIA